MRLPGRTALLAVTGNAVFMGIVGVTSPLGWLLLPGVAGMSTRPRVAVLVSGWAATLVAVSVAIPVVPGHRHDGPSLAASAVCLSLVPFLSWSRQRARAIWWARTQAPMPGVATISVGSAGPRVALAVSRVPGEIAVTVPMPGRRVCALLGLVMGQVADPARCAAKVERAFRRAADLPGLSLRDMATVLTPVVRHNAPDGYVAATLVQVQDDGVVELLRCGGPEIFALQSGSAGLGTAEFVAVDGGPGGLPLGLGKPPAVLRRVPDHARAAVVTAGYALAHYDDYAQAIPEALRARTIELAAAHLLFGPYRARRAGNLVGPALVIDTLR